MDKPQHILITGGAGFIGSRLSKYLLNKGLRITVIDNLSTGTFENILKLTYNPDFEFIEADICDYNFHLAQNPDVIYHLAATVGVDKVVNSPVETLKNNILSTMNVLDIAEKFNCKLVLFSSSEVYGNTTNLPMKEEQDYNIGLCKYSRWSYSVSKIVDEFLAYAYNQRGLDCVVVRLFNVIGKGQSGRYGMVVPRFIEAALKSENLSVFGDGLQTRCFCDIRDIISGLYKIISLPVNGFHLFNLGNNIEISIIELAKTIIKLTGSNSKIDFIPYSMLGSGFEDLRRRIPDLSKAKEILDWEPQYTLNNSIEDIISDYIRVEYAKCFQY